MYVGALLPFFFQGMHRGQRCAKSFRIYIDGGGVWLVKFWERFLHTFFRVCEHWREGVPRLYFEVGAWLNFFLKMATMQCFFSGVMGNGCAISFNMDKEQQEWHLSKSCCWKFRVISTFFFRDCAEEKEGTRGLESCGKGFWRPSKKVITGIVRISFLSAHRRVRVHHLCSIVVWLKRFGKRLSMANELDDASLCFEGFFFVRGRGRQKVVRIFKSWLQEYGTCQTFALIR